MTSCQSVKVVYVNRYIVPDYDWPFFPAMDREKNYDENGKVISWTIPIDDIDTLSEFYINYEKERKSYYHDKELYEKTKDVTLEATSSETLSTLSR